MPGLEALWTGGGGGVAGTCRVQVQNNVKTTLTHLVAASVIKIYKNRHTN